MSEWFSSGSRQLLLGGLLLEILFLLWQWQFQSDVEVRNVRVVPESLPRIEHVNARAMVEKVLSRNLWKAKRDESASDAQGESKAKTVEVLLHWRLHALSKRGDDMSALIGLEGKPASIKSYRQGEHLAANVLVLELLDDRVVLLDDKKRKVIYLFGRE